VGREDVLQFRSRHRVVHRIKEVKHVVVIDLFRVFAFRAEKPELDVHRFAGDGVHGGIRKPRKFLSARGINLPTGRTLDNELIAAAELSKLSANVSYDAEAVERQSATRLE
jgi:hypothetical protein